MIALTSTSMTLELVTTSTASTDYNVTYVDHTSSGGTAGSSDGNIASATTTTILAAPGASAQRQIRQLTIKNKGTSSQTVTLQKDVSGSNREITPAITLAAQETLLIDSAGMITLYDSAGRRRDQASEIGGALGFSRPLYKVGTAAEAVGIRHSLHAATGYPGAWAPGTPGVAGRATDGTAAGDAGCIPVPNPASGANYLNQYLANSSIAQYHILADYLWVNSGLVVTTTTAQTVNSVAFPARDDNGSANGAGVQVGILVTTATTNAGAVTNTTMSYTNQGGTAGKTATISSFPATAVAGTFVPFQLAAGDTGVRSIQSVTLGTSYGGGAISLVAFRDIATCPVMLANVGNKMFELPASPGVRLYSGVCLIPTYIASATTATTVHGMIIVQER